MNLSYDRATILQGKSQQRMAGPVGARAMELMTNPAAQAATNNWMSMFSQSNQGTEFNMAKQQQANAQAEVAVLDAEVDGRIS